jgi:hypothetical protein
MDDTDSQPKNTRLAQERDLREPAGKALGWIARSLDITNSEVAQMTGIKLKAIGNIFGGDGKYADKTYDKIAEKLAAKAKNPEILFLQGAIDRAEAIRADLIYIDSFPEIFRAYREKLSLSPAQLEQRYFPETKYTCLVHKIESRAIESKPIFVLHCLKKLGLSSLREMIEAAALSDKFSYESSLLQPGTPKTVRDYIVTRRSYSEGRSS